MLLRGRIHLWAQQQSALMVTVIIPALNEEKTIASVVRYCQSKPAVAEIIVVDDKSFDNTVKYAQEAGAKVITSTKIGKGASMKDGLLCAKNNIVVFLDGDIDPYPEKMLEQMTAPIIADRFDFIKATFARNSGRVTELVAKPLLSMFFPELAHYSQPLSGMIAGKKKFFENIDFYNDYGVDVGIKTKPLLEKSGFKLNPEQIITVLNIFDCNISPGN